MNCDVQLMYSSSCRLVLIWYYTAHSVFCTPTLVPSLHSSDNNKYVVTPRRVAYGLIEQKCSRLKQNTLLIEGFKPGASPFVSCQRSIIDKSIRQQVGQFFIMVIRQDFAQGRPFFYTNLKKGWYARQACHKSIKKNWNQCISILSPVFIFNTVPTREEIVIENLQHSISCVALCRVTR